MSMFNEHNSGGISIPYREPRQPLSISDVERLAKAGVQIKFEDIAAQVQPDCLPPPPYDPVANLNESFWQRWMRANPVRQDRFEGMMRPWQIHATEFGDKVYVYVAPHDAEPFILEDEKHLYPSDALMAKLHLWGKNRG